VIFNVKINNFNPQININLRVKTYSKTMPTRNYSRRKRQQKSQIIALTGLVTAAVALVLILAKLIFSGVTTLASDGSLDLSDANSYELRYLLLTLLYTPTMVLAAKLVKILQSQLVPITMMLCSMTKIPH